MPINITYDDTEDEQTINSVRLKTFLNMTPNEGVSM